METTRKDIDTTLTVSEDTARLVHLFDTCGDIYDTVTDVLGKHYRVYDEYKNL